MTISSRALAAVLAAQVLAVACMLLGACAPFSSPGGIGGPSALTGAPFAGDFGATQGGVQDMGLARELIAAGRVPPPEAFVVEGMFSEHELGLTGEACARTLCLRAALGIAPILAGDASGWMQVGLSSTIDQEAFVRPSLTVIATVDISGSMGWDYTAGGTAYPTAGEVSRNLLSAIAAELTAADRIAIVTYGTTVATVLDLTPGDQQVAVQAAIDSLSTGGVTDMESGLVRAYEMAPGDIGVTEEVRVMLFTDIQPNVGATSASEFEQIVQGGASSGVGITVMGVGVGLGQELMNAMSHIRGGNAFSLFDNEDVVEVMDDDWPWLVSPIAYDLSLEVTPSAGFGVASTYGFPAGETDQPSPVMDVSTIFLSKRKGALLVQITPDSGESLDGLGASGQLSYTTPAGEPITEQLSVAYEGEDLDANGQYFEQPAVGKTVALAILVTAMHDAAEVYGEDQAAAVAIMESALARFTATAESLGDTTLDPEAQLAADLLDLMKEGAEQGDLYGQVENGFF